MSDLLERLGVKIEMIGRGGEVEKLRSYLRAPGGERHFVYYWAQGGLGKTRLMQELEKIVRAAGTGYYFSGIIDLYHTDTHSPSDLERAIIRGLDPEEKWFRRYREMRATYEKHRELGADPGILEKQRASLAGYFIEGCKELAEAARKIVICFDTVELLQYESSVVEDLVGPDTADTRIRPWLLDKLSRLNNVLVVFAGRPKLPTPGEPIDHHARLIEDMQEAFGNDLTVVELEPFTLKETEDFIEEATGEEEIIPPRYLPVVHCLTGGKPIFLQLTLDLLKVLAPEPRVILELFDRYADLTDEAGEEAQLQAARQTIERQILNAIFNEAGEMGGYLSRIALMPKGVNSEILQTSLGLPSDEVERLIAQLAPLSFVKRFTPLVGTEPPQQLHEERIFLHDEMYRLLTPQGIIPHHRMNERSVAHTLVQNYYEPHIQKLQEETSDVSIPVEERVRLRERLHELQVERMYYLLVSNPREGYAEYKRLTGEANRNRQTGFGMRLLDEFLRFYNVPERRKLFETVGLTPEQIIKESAWMWVERFECWGQPQKVIKLAEQIFKSPELFSIQCSEDATICSDQDLTLMGNIYAFWTSSHAKLSGYTLAVMERAQAMLRRLPVLTKSTQEQALARARLNNRIGYLYRLGGMLDQAAMHYIEAKAAFRKLDELGQYEGEYASLLNNLAFVYAKQGRMDLARPLSHEALRRSESRGSKYGTGLTLSTLCQIACIRGNYAQAREYGEEALKLFRELEDARGIALSQQGIAQAERQTAKHELEKGRNQEKALQQLENARHTLEQALQVAQETSIGSLIPELYAELGRVYRDLGRITNQAKGFEEAARYYRQAEHQLNSALEPWSQSEALIVERADTLQDLAEVFFALGEKEAVKECLTQIENIIGPDYLIIPDKQIPKDGLPVQYFSPLGKVEMLRGQLAFDEGALEEYVQHFVMAYAYFTHFSADAVEKDTMIEYLYNHLFDEPIIRQQALMSTVRAWIASHDFGIDVEPFVQTLGMLLGV